MRLAGLGGLLRACAPSAAGRIASGAGAAVLLGSLYLRWYGPEAPPAGTGRALSAWGAFGTLDAVLVAAAAAGLWAAAVRPARWLAALRALAGAGAVLLVAVKAASPPAIAGSPREGVAVALLGAGALAAGGLADLRGGRAPAPRAREAERAPGRPLDPAGGATLWQAGELRAARVESLRALAALCVVATHVFIVAQVAASTSGVVTHAFQAGAYGVYFFFVLSGYLLFRPFVRRLVDGRGELSLRHYAINRALRILPLYYVVVAVLLALHVNGGRPDQWWRFALFAENYSAGTVLRADSPIWSLAVEVHFYVVLPLVALAVGWVARGSRARAALGVVALGLASLAARVLLVQASAAPDFRWTFSLPTLFFFFAGGMLLALLRARWDERAPGWAGRGALGAGDLWVAASAPLWALAAWRTDFEPVVVAAAFLVVAGCVLRLRPGVATRVLEWRPLATLGVASYSLYLWHVPLITAVGGNPVDFRPTGPVFEGHPHRLLYLGVLSLAVCCAAALASYALIESPFLRLRRRWAARTGRS